MRRVFLFLCFCFASYLTFGQDIIILKDGTEIEVKVKEVRTDVIRYVKFSNPNGPIYEDFKSNIFMIKYENGSKDVFNSNESVPQTSNSVEGRNKASAKNALGVKAGFFNLRYYEGNNKISKSTFVNRLQSDPIAYEYYTKHRSQNIFKRFFSGGSMLGALFAISFVLDMNSSAALTSAIAGSLSGLIGRYFRNKSASNLELAVITYNKNLSN